MTAVAIVFWLCAFLIIYAQIGYGLVLVLLGRVMGKRVAASVWNTELPQVSVIVAAYAEADVISTRIANLRAQDYPAGRVEIVVACDGSPDQTPELARTAGADIVLDLDRAGKVAAQDAAVRSAHGTLLAFSDANVHWAPDALRRLVDRFADPAVGYVCGEVTFTSDEGATNQEGIYWRYELLLRRYESELASITAGNGAIYATRAEDYLELGPLMSHDISFPFKFVKRGRKALFAPEAHATEKMAPTVEREFTRKRRMASRTWPVVLTAGMLSPRGYGPMYALMIYSHRVLRYLSPFLHLIALATSIALIGHGLIYLVALILQVALLMLAAVAPAVPNRLTLIARYYVLTTLSLALGLWDYAKGARRVAWEPVEGTR
jgi:cellulose synthase/poly-beta-1,6-N-acetylglucosamine synthase-like glycosyltransferase